MPSARELFTDEALEELSSPEQLDQLLKVTQPSGWLALFAVGFLIFSIIVWGFLGTIPTKLNGRGILVHPGGVSSVVALANGAVESIRVKPGQTVRPGDTIAELSLPQLAERVDTAAEELSEATRKLKLFERSQKQELKLHGLAFVGKRETLVAQIAAGKKKISFLKNKLKNKNDLLKMGLITKQQLFAVKQELSDTQEEMERINDNLNDLKVRETQINSGSAREKLLLRISVDEARRRYQDLMEEWEMKRHVTSLHNGRVVEITADVGTLVQAGTQVVGVELHGQSLEAVVYVSPRDGKKIKAGMEIHIAPSIVKKEEFGLMLGKVREVSDYPSTRSGMMAVLNNPDLVDLFLDAGPPIAVYADILLDPKAKSGFKWTSGVGPPVIVSGGTVCNADVIVKRRAPISLVVPYIRSKLGF
jgi:HlyD family secretion protein